jgi:hypothetical protein
VRILVLTADDESFLETVYQCQPGLHLTSSDEQYRARYETMFGDADFLSRNFHALGQEAAEIFVNNIWLQSAWAREHGMDVPDPPLPGTKNNTANGNMVTFLKRKLSPYRKVLAPLARKLGYMRTLTPVERRILLAQIEDANPDIILNQMPGIVTADILNQVKRPGRIIIVQHGNIPPDNFDPGPYTFAMAIVPNIVEFFRSHGLPTEYYRLAFGASVLDRLPPSPPAKDIDVSFVGGLSANHHARIALLEAVVRELPVQLYLSNFKGIPKGSPLHAHAKSAVWGRDMYDTLRRSKITLNSHVDAAGRVAANMRLYEATGVGTFLLTDNLRGLSDLFTPGQHVAAYDSPADCVAKIKYYLTHDAEREAIAAAGQQHTLSHHTYRHRAEEILRLVGKYS